MTVGVALDVMLKGVDLFADTALLTLRGKMGYSDNLMAIKRIDTSEFQFESPAPGDTLAKLKRFLNTQTLFYNRNKHHYSLRAWWDGGRLEDGVPGDFGARQLVAQVRKLLEVTLEDFRSTDGKSRVMLKNVPVFRTEVLVEDLDPTARESTGRKLELELSTGPVRVTSSGTRWLLGLRAGSPEDARALAEEIAVTERRDRGLLLNPNYQKFRFLDVERVELGE